MRFYQMWDTSNNNVFDYFWLLNNDEGTGGTFLKHIFDFHFQQIPIQFQKIPNNS